MRNYEYSARLADSKRHPIYDGDTVRLDIDCGFGIWKCNTVCRLWGINAPEMRGPSKVNGTLSRDRLREMLFGSDDLWVRTHRDKTGKYGRYLVEIFISLEDWREEFDYDSVLGTAHVGSFDENLLTLVNVNRAMVVNGYAVGYMRD